MDEMEASHQRYMRGKRLIDDAHRALGAVVSDPDANRFLNEEDLVRMCKSAGALRQASDHIVAVWD